MVRAFFSLLVFTALCIDTCYAQQGTDADKTSAPSAAKLSDVRSFHAVPDEVETAPPNFDADQLANTTFHEILKTFGISAVDWSVTTTSSPRKTQYAISTFNSSTGRRGILFNSTFLQTIAESYGKWAVNCVTAHEISHHLRSHYQKNGYVSTRDAELEADYDCGLVLGKMGATYDEAAAVLERIPNSAEYPSREERREAIGKGWRDATGRSWGGEDELMSPLKIRRRHILLLTQFSLQQNRDIYGSDLASTDGKPGIPGLSQDTCADRCRKDATCEAFSFDKWAGMCFIKGEARLSILDPRSVTGVKKKFAMPQRANGKYVFVVSRDRSFPDEPWDERDAADRSICQKICDQSARCVAYTYLKKAQSGVKTCRLFNQTDGYFEDANADSGFKSEVPASAPAAGTTAAMPEHEKPRP